MRLHKLGWPLPETEKPICRSKFVTSKITVFGHILENIFDNKKLIFVLFGDSNLVFTASDMLSEHSLGTFPAFEWSYDVTQTNPATPRDRKVDLLVEISDLKNH